MALPYEFLHGIGLDSLNANMKKISFKQCFVRDDSECEAYLSLSRFYEVWNALRKFDQLDGELLVFSNRYGFPLFRGKDLGYYNSGMWPSSGGWDYYCFMDNQQDTLAASITDCGFRLRQPLSITIDEAELDVYSNNDNIMCVIHKS